METAAVVAVLLVAFVVVVATWFYRKHLGNPPSRLSWMWPGFLTLGLAVFTVVEFRRSTVGFVSIGAVITATELYFYGRHGSEDGRGSDGRRSPKMGLRDGWD